MNILMQRIEQDANVARVSVEDQYKLGRDKYEKKMAEIMFETMVMWTASLNVEGWDVEMTVRWASLKKKEIEEELKEIVPKRMPMKEELYYRIPLKALVPNVDKELKEMAEEVAMSLKSRVVLSVIRQKREKEADPLKWVEIQEDGNMRMYVMAATRGLMKVRHCPQLLRDMIKCALIEMAKSTIEMDAETRAMWNVYKEGGRGSFTAINAANIYEYIYRHCKENVPEVVAELPPPTPEKWILVSSDDEAEAEEEEQDEDIHFEQEVVDEEEEEVFPMHMSMRGSSNSVPSDSDSESTDSNVKDVSDILRDRYPVDVDENVMTSSIPPPLSSRSSARNSRYMRDRNLTCSNPYCNIPSHRDLHSNRIIQ